MVRVTFIYAGHQLDYLLGLISGFDNNSSLKVSLIDGKRVTAFTANNGNIELKPFLFQIFFKIYSLDDYATLTIA